VLIADQREAQPTIAPRGDDVIDVGIATPVETLSTTAPASNGTSSKAPMVS
jgi:hypothetical protein